MTQAQSATPGSQEQLRDYFAARARFNSQACPHCNHWPAHLPGECMVPCEDDGAVRCGCQAVAS